MRSFLMVTMLIVLVAVVAIGVRPKRDRIEPEVLRPEQLADFDTLFRNNCSGCHGPNGQAGAAPPIGDAAYLALADDDSIRMAASFGVRGTSMPAFAQSAGGLLADKQIDLIVEGMRKNWARPNALAGMNPPPYAVRDAGDAGRGAKAFGVYCAGCHGASGSGGPKGPSVVDGSYLALVSNQGLRTMILIGRPAMGFPNWHDDQAGKPMSDQEISDVVAWLGGQRPKAPGQPYPPVLKAGGAQ